MGDETLKNYQKFVGTTIAYPQDGYPISNELAELMYLGSKLAGEAGEVSEKIAKMFRDLTCISDGERTVPKLDMVIARGDILKELGDVQWYITMIAKRFGITLEQIMEENERKLTDRLERGVIGGSGDNR